MKKTQRWLRWLLSGGLLLLLLYTIDAQAVGTILWRSQPTYLLLAFVVALSDRVLMAYKWTLLLRAKGMMLPLGASIGIYWVSTFLGLFLPATVGGDALRTYAVAKSGYHTADVISSIVIERALGFIALFIFALAGITANLSVLGEDFIGSMRLVWLFVFLLIISTCTVVLSLNTRLLRRLNTILEHRQRNAQRRKIVGRLQELHGSYAGYRHHRLTLMIFLGLSLVENLLPLIWTYLLALGLHIQVPLLYFFILVPLVLVLVRLPISLDGFGLQEGAFIYFLGLVGVVYSEAFLLGITSHILALGSLLPGGLLYGVGGLGIQTKRGTPTPSTGPTRSVDDAAPNLTFQRADQCPPPEIKRRVFPDRIRVSPYLRIRIESYAFSMLAWAAGILLRVALLLRKAAAIIRAEVTRAIWHDIKTSIEFKVARSLFLAVVVAVAVLAFVARR